MDAPDAKNGTSDPTVAASATRSMSSRFQIVASARSTAPASLDPPPRPAAMGTRFRMWTNAAGSRPAAAANARTARLARSSPGGAPTSGAIRTSSRRCSATRTRSARSIIANTLRSS
jgi:hypothetical protein